MNTGTQAEARNGEMLLTLKPTCALCPWLPLLHIRAPPPAMLLLHTTAAMPQCLLAVCAAAAPAPQSPLTLQSLLTTNPCRCARWQLHPTACWLLMLLALLKPDSLLATDHSLHSPSQLQNPADDTPVTTPVLPSCPRTCSCLHRMFSIVSLRVRAWWISIEAPPGYANTAWQQEGQANAGQHTVSCVKQIACRC